MGLIDWVKRHIAGRAIKGKVKDARSGRLGAVVKAVWGAVDGWKTWIWAIVQAAKLTWPEASIWTWVDWTANVLGWQHVLPAIDPGQLVTAVTFFVAAGHKLRKAWQQYRAGATPSEVLSDVGSVKKAIAEKVIPSVPITPTDQAVPPVV